ncbi:hypothetical protein HO173_010101 [Letharia columbiana]|uniref:Uncharacterized protein n=1 Tax=Letharia columbiana TaxID=112416 RepID=A0A8H6FNJ6_9LECA|nr:uncharacterized protein HO173_010101 [Letharia columbiana]KAF6231799.1 hypothetical protein HO173_010101 [Letharia columbiana]
MTSERTLLRSPLSFPEWARETGYHNWFARGTAENLGAIGAFVSWEQTVGAAETDIKASETAEARKYRENGLVYPRLLGEGKPEWTSIVSTKTKKDIDISAEKTKPDGLILVKALLTYIIPFDKSNLRFTETEKATWKARYSVQKWWVHWSTDAEGGVL